MTTRMDVHSLPQARREVVGRARRGMMGKGIRRSLAESRRQQFIADFGRFQLSFGLAELRRLRQ